MDDTQTILFSSASRDRFVRTLECGDNVPLRIFIFILFVNFYELKVFKLSIWHQSNILDV